MAFPEEEYRNSPILVGIDLVSMKRLQKILLRSGEKFSKLVYTPDEWTSYQYSIRQLAESFATKEAVSKALGVGLAHLNVKGVPANEIELIWNVNNTPCVRLLGRALSRANTLNISAWVVSLSQTEQCSISVVLAVRSL